MRFQYAIIKDELHPHISRRIVALFNLIKPAEKKEKTAESRKIGVFIPKGSNQRKNM